LASLYQHASSPEISSSCARLRSSEMLASRINSQLLCLSDKSRAAGASSAIQRKNFCCDARIQHVDAGPGAWRSNIGLARAFSSEVNTGSREENASKTRIWSSASVLIQSEGREEMERG
jgi:hypothetical protein